MRIHEICPSKRTENDWKPCSVFRGTVVHQTATRHAWHAGGGTPRRVCRCVALTPHTLCQFPPRCGPLCCRPVPSAAQTNGGPRRADQSLPSRMHCTLALCVCLCAPSLARWRAHRSDILEQEFLGLAPCGCPCRGRSIARRAPQPLPLSQPPRCICGVVLLMRGLLCNAPPLLPTHTVSHLNVRAPSGLVHAVRIAEPLSKLHPARGTPCILASHAHSFSLMVKEGVVHAMKARRRFSI